jgi:predicted nucleic acid-binding protein
VARYFLDSSVVVKRYVAETGSAWIRRLCAPAGGNALYAAHVMGAEVSAAIMRRVRRGEITAVDAAFPSLQAHLRTDYTPVYVTDALVQRAVDLTRRYPLRGYDAVHLASALQLAAECVALGIPAPIFVCADTDLNAAASAEGLAVDDPNAHP